MLVVARKPRMPGSWPHPQGISGLQQGEPKGACSGGSILHTTLSLFSTPWLHAWSANRYSLWKAQCLALLCLPPTNHPSPRHQPSPLWNEDNSNCPLTPQSWRPVLKIKEKHILKCCEACCSHSEIMEKRDKIVGFLKIFLFIYLALPGCGMWDLVVF